MDNNSRKGCSSQRVQERDVFLQLCACMQEQGGGNLSIPCDASRREYMFRLKLSFNTILRGYNSDLVTSFEHLPIINCNYCLWRKMDQILYIYWPNMISNTVASTPISFLVYLAGSWCNLLLRVSPDKERKLELIFMLL